MAKWRSLGPVTSFKATAILNFYSKNSSLGKQPATDI